MLNSDSYVDIHTTRAINNYPWAYTAIHERHDDDRSSCVILSYLLVYKYYVRLRISFG